MDVLDDILDTLNLKGALYFRTNFSGPWAVTVPELPQAARFHLVLQGSCHVEIRDGETALLGPGDLVMIPRGRSHVLADRAGRNARPLETVLSDAAYDGRGVLTVGHQDPTATTQMVCGHLSFRSFADHPILNALPPCIVVTATMRLQEPWLDELLRMMTQRIFTESLGSAASVRRLSEIAFAEIIRTGIGQDQTLQTILSGYRDPQIGHALETIHGAAEKPWTVATLAAEVGMSRSSFAERFHDMVGQTPANYLSNWRLQKALSLLDDSRRTIQQVGAEIGYLSSAAFSRAFSGKFGLSPTEYRRKRI